MTGFLLNMPDSVALFVLGVAMFVMTLVLRRVLDATESSREEIGAKTR